MWGGVCPAHSAYVLFEPIRYSDGPLASTSRLPFEATGSHQSPPARLCHHSPSLSRAVLALIYAMSALSLSVPGALPLVSVCSVRSGDTLRFPWLRVRRGVCVPRYPRPFCPELAPDCKKKTPVLLYPNRHEPRQAAGSFARFAKNIQGPGGRDPDSWLTSLG